MADLETKVDAIKTEEITQETPADADDKGSTPETVPSSDDQNKESETPKKSIEDMLSELMAENAKLKREKDRASADAAKYKRESMANKTEAEQKAIEKAEEDARIKEELAELRKESALNKLEKSFVMLGYSEEMAKQAAEAQYDGNTDLLFQIQKKYFAEKERAIKSQLMKTLPAPSISNDENFTVTEDQFNKMGYKERLELAQKHPKVYEQLTK